MRLCCWGEAQISQICKECAHKFPHEASHLAFELTAMCQCGGWVGLACLRVFSILCIDPPPHNCSKASPGQWVVCRLEMIWIIHPESFLRITICIPLLLYHLSPSLMPLLWTLSDASHYWCHWWLSGSRQKESKSLLVFFFTNATGQFWSQISFAVINLLLIPPKHPSFVVK